MTEARNSILGVVGIASGVATYFALRHYGCFVEGVEYGGSHIWGGMDTTTVRVMASIVVGLVVPSVLGAIAGHLGFGRVGEVAKRWACLEKNVESVKADVEAIKRKFGA